MLLISPEEFPVFLLDIPRLKAQPPGLIIESHLKNLYPGDPRDTEFDYYIRPVRGRKAQAPRYRAIVFVTSRVIRSIRTKQDKTLFPGIFFMILAARMARRKKTGIKTQLVLLLTEDWLEAARFENGEVTGYSSASWTAGEQDGIPAGLIPSLCGSLEGEKDGFSVSAILREPPHGALQSLLSARELKGIPVNTLEFSTLAAGLRGKKYAVFNGRKQRNPGHAALAGLVLCLGILFFPLRSLSLRYEGILSRVKDAHTEKLEARESANRYEQQITEILSRTQNNQGVFYRNFYRIICVLESCLKGAWVRSLSLGETSFNLDAEGADSLGVVHALESSPCFSGMVLHQASPSKIRAEQFIISGDIIHER
ncbi:MAG: hypothetical protein LBD78_10275 [Spirochaetaceae bacterium]|jgi:hypothetical protein|nr:hypothetical protein [Spirochaetaceae bacterium]